MDKAYPLSSPMFVHSLDVKNDPLRSCEKGEKLLGSKNHILVPLVHLCILLTTLVQILLIL